MLKLGKFALAIALALMSLSLLTSGVFAQSTKTDNKSSAQTAVVTTTLQGVQQTQQANNTQQATQKLNWGPRWGWGHRFHHRRFFHRRFFHRRFFHRRFFHRRFYRCKCGWW